MSPYLAGAILIGFMIWTGAAGYAGYKWSQDACETAKANELQAEIKARIEAENASKAIANSYEIHKAQSEGTINGLLKQVGDAHAKNPSNCIVSADRLSAIRAAAKSTSSSRLGAGLPAASTTSAK